MLLRFIVLGLALISSAPLFAQTSPREPIGPGIIVPLWPDGKMPGIATTDPENTLQKPHDGVRWVTNVSQPTIDIFKAPGATGPVPAMIICPGGGYGGLAINYEGTEIAKWLNSIGITGIVLKYRVPKNRDGALQDIERAMRLTRQHASEWGIQPDKLGVIGFSAGGHLAARLSNNFDKEIYAPIDDADKLSCRPDFVILAYPGYLESHHLLAPELTLPANLPPTLLVHTEDDLNYVLGSKIYDAALTAANLPHKFLLYPTGGHGFCLRSNLAVKVWPVDAAAWLHSIGIL